MRIQSFPFEPGCRHEDLWVHDITGDWFFKALKNIIDRSFSGNKKKNRVDGITLKKAKDIGKFVDGSENAIKLLYKDVGIDAQYFINLLNEINDYLNDSLNKNFIPFYYFALQEWLTYIHWVFDEEYKYRDHLFHSFYVALIGDFLLKKYELNGKSLYYDVASKIEADVDKLIERLEKLKKEEPEKAAIFNTSFDRILDKVKDGKEKLFKTDEKNKHFVLLTWFIASMYHDIGFYIGTFKAQHDIFHSSMFDGWMDKIYTFPFCNKTNSCFGWLYNGTAEEECNLLGRLFGVGSDLYHDYEGDLSVPFVLEYEVLKRTHPLWGFMELGNFFMDESSDGRSKISYYLAARAIIKHHYSGKNGERFEYSEDPLGFLLRLADQLQNASRFKLRKIDGIKHSIVFQKVFSKGSTKFDNSSPGTNKIEVHIGEDLNQEKKQEFLIFEEWMNSDNIFKVDVNFYDKDGKRLK